MAVCAHGEAKMSQDGHGEKVGQVGHLDQEPDSKSLTYIYLATWPRRPNFSPLATLDWAGHLDGLALARAKAC
jgi:hypothetical protein